MIGDKGNMVFLNHRTRAASGAELFVSIHHDSMRESVIATRRDQLAEMKRDVLARIEDDLATAYRVVQIVVRHSTRLGATLSKRVSTGI